MIGFLSSTMVGCYRVFAETFLLALSNLMSDRPNSSPNQEDNMGKKKSHRKTFSEKSTSDQPDEPDTSSFTAFIFSLFKCTKERDQCSDDDEGKYVEMDERDSMKGPKIVGSRKHRNAKAKHSSGKSFNPTTSTSKYEHQNSSQEPGNHVGNNHEADWQLVTENDLKSEMGLSESMQEGVFPEMTEPSFLLSKSFSSFLSSALPTVAQGQKWMLLYSTRKHGISLLTLYRRSAYCPGPCLLVVGDHQGAVFGGLLAAPLLPTSSKKYSGSNDNFVFTNVSGRPIMFRPTGANRYFVLCSNDSLALGGGGHFALYLDGDLLRGSSGYCETFGNSCLARTEDFELKDVELWGFAYASKYLSTMASYGEPQEPPGIFRW
ncbi:uncharacterized protein LOC131038229 isoform X1 [Cryptomeria japonica]|uniref:uncharacterized protein LOC131038229 isoform X1 n=2 Tax=Cryptomeria japonica TaxID=3369 RepID=UPI0027DAB151|nr:uncharacterized protein LOC131038229 isoform X1 [Cryptomeria japonica]